MSVQIEHIRLDGGTQSRAAINEATVAEYAEAMADPSTVFPPVTVYFDGREYWLADGFHRVEAWRRIGRTDIPAEIRQGDVRKAILHSVAANAAHGLRRTNDDKRRAVLTLLEDEEWSAWSDREIARRCGVSHPFVATVRADLSGNGFQMPDSRTVERGGTTYQQNTSNIGAKAAEKPEQVSTEAVPEPAENTAPEPAEAHETSTAPEEDRAIAKARRELGRLTPEALVDEVIGLRATLADERAKRRAADAKIGELKEQIAVFEADHEMGAKLGAALGEIRKANGRLKETQVQLARETRRANAFEAANKKLRAEIENQVFQL